MKPAISDNQSTWDIRFLMLAKHIADWSKDPSTKVGACIVSGKNRVVSLGYNGFPAGIDDSSERLNDRDTKLSLTIHGEINAIRFASTDISGCTLYTWPMIPCERCAVQVIQYGIKRVVSIVASPDRELRWKSSFDLSRSLFAEAGVELSEYIGFDE